MKRWNRQIGPAAEITLHRAGGDADDRGNDGQRQPEQHRDAEAVDQPRQHVAAAIVGAEPVGFELAAFGETVLGGEFAILLREHPGRLRRQRRRRIAHLRVVGEANRRPDHGAAFLLDQAHQVIVAIVGRGAEQIRVRSLGEGRVGIGHHRREIRMAVDVDVDRLVVGDEFRKQRNQEQRQKKPQRPVAAPVGLEVLPAPPVERRNADAAPFRRHDQAARPDGRGVGRFDPGAGVHLRPPASRNRCADRSTYR